MSRDKFAIVSVKRGHFFGGNTAKARRLHRKENLRELNACVARSATIHETERE
jgi:hypothetical protein